MTDLEPILGLWRELENSGAEYVVATIVAVEGSSYRRPGARMLLAQDGRRAGTVSGGCLEAEVARRAFWLTADGPVIERYSTLEDDGDLPYGSGCGGVVFILLERRLTAAPLLSRLEAAFAARAPLAIATVLSGLHIGRRAFGDPSFNDPASLPLQVELDDLAHAALADRKTFEDEILIDTEPTRVRVEYCPARPALWIFGAGDDAKPLVHIARELGWFTAVADGRSHLATAARFPIANEVHLLPASDQPLQFDLRLTDAAVLMTHSFEQDARALTFLLACKPAAQPAYIGVLGPQRRTRELLNEATRRLHLTPTAKLLDQWLEDLHAPMGLDLGAEAPNTIALSVVAEIQKALTSSTALPLRQVRATKLDMASRKG